MTGILPSGKFLSVSFTIVSIFFSESVETALGKNDITAEAIIQQRTAVLKEKMFYSPMIPLLNPYSKCYKD